MGRLAALFDAAPSHLAEVQKPTTDLHHLEIRAIASGRVLIRPAFGDAFAFDVVTPSAIEEVSLCNLGSPANALTGPTSNVGRSNAPSIPIGARLGAHRWRRLPTCRRLGRRATIAPVPQ